jgi:hypothetical protein
MMKLFFTGTISSMWMRMNSYFLRLLANHHLTPAVIRQNIARNPHVPLETLWKLGVEFPKQVIQNPRLLLLRLENPNQPDLLERLFNLMDETQKLSFKKAAVQQTIYYITKKLPSPEADEGERLFIEVAKNWLWNPTEEVANRANAGAAADCIDGGVRYFDYPEIFLEPAWAAGAKTGLGAAQSALTAAGTNFAEVALQWQITATWAILYDEKLPVLE